MTEIKCEFGCDCDTPSTFLPHDAVLDQNDFDRLVQGKILRAERYRACLDQLSEQFKTD